MIDVMSRVLMFHVQVSMSNFATALRSYGSVVFRTEKQSLAFTQLTDPSSQAITMAGIEETFGALLVGVFIAAMYVPLKLPATLTAQI